MSEHAYQCKKCGCAVQSETLPAPGECPDGGRHQWERADPAELMHPYQCGKCGQLVKARSTPCALRCPTGEQHEWKRVR